MFYEIESDGLNIDVEILGEVAILSHWDENMCGCGEDRESFANYQNMWLFFGLYPFIVAFGLYLEHSEL